MFYGNDKLIINVALTGMIPTRADNPYLPITPDEIAEDVVRCANLGATIFHIHARGADGRPTHEPDGFRAILDAIRTRTREPVILCVTTSGRLLNTFEARSAVLNLAREYRIDMASLTVGSLNFPKQASVTDPGMIEGLATRMSDVDVVPELEVFDTGMIHYSKYLLKTGVLSDPLYYNILLGSLGSAPADPRMLITMVEELPENATWAATGIGRFQFPVNCLAIALGGHVRVGLEDAIFMNWKTRESATNARLVERLVAVAQSQGREPATISEARAIIGLRPAAVDRPDTSQAS